MLGELGGDIDCAPPHAATPAIKVIATKTRRMSVSLVGYLTSLRAGPYATGARQREGDVTYSAISLRKSSVCKAASFSTSGPAAAPLRPVCFAAIRRSDLSPL